MASEEPQTGRRSASRQDRDPRQQFRDYRIVRFLPGNWCRGRQSNTNVARSWTAWWCATSGA